MKTNMPAGTPFSQGSRRGALAGLTTYDEARENSWRLFQASQDVVLLTDDISQCCSDSMDGNEGEHPWE